MPAATKALRIDLLIVEARTPADLEGAFDEIARQPADSLLVFDDAMFISIASKISILAAKLKLPTISGISALPENGALMSYGPDRMDMLRRAATLVDKILKGAKPADLPVEQPTKFEMVINMNAAKVLGIKIPQVVLLRADRVIE